ncbi:hypothetical protein ABZ622_36530 [Streptomyces sp. NPDC007164]|uniref:hypothetical protein n=1 Tax=Streptomyces sp. NPDC007164 TaxID=3156918 RepID=UPI0034077272
MTEAGKVALVAALITTVGGGVFGLVNALPSVLGGNASEHATDGQPDPRLYPDCNVGDNSLLTCTNTAGIWAYKDRDVNSGTTRLRDSSTFRCWVKDKNVVWYWMDTHAGEYGNVPASNLTRGKVVPGVGEC